MQTGNTNQNIEQDTPQESEQEEATEKPANVPEGWVMFESKTQNFTVFRPADWLVWDDCDGYDMGFITATAEEFGPLCNSGKPMQVSIWLSENEIGYNNCEDFSNNSEIKLRENCDTVTLSGLSGYRFEIVGSGDGYYPEETLRVIYELDAGNNQKYFLSYTEQPNWPEELNTFENIVESFKVN